MLAWIKSYRIGIFFFIVGAIVGSTIEWPYRELVKILYQSEYAKHVFECDNAMRAHFIAKAHVKEKPSEETVKSLGSAEVGLVACHEYDKFRKKLVSLGLTENDLSEIGLKAIEKSKNTLHTLVREHEIRY